MAANLFDKLSPKAAFLASLLTNAGFNVAELIEKNDANALKAHIDGLTAKAAGDPAAIKTAIEQATHELQTQVTGLEGKLTAAEGKVTQLTTLTSALESAGVKITADADPAKVKAAVELHSATVARNMVAKVGHPGLLDDPALDPTKHSPVSSDKAKVPEGVTGRERVAFALNQQFRNRMRN